MRAWIGLGSNLNDPQTQLQRAVDALARLPHSQLMAVSPVYRSPPLLPPTSTPASTPASQNENAPRYQPDYLNAVAGLETSLAPLDLLTALQAIEHAQGRVRGEHWGARTLDLDVLLYGNTVLTHERLTLPHPGLHERRFVLQPLADIAPDLVLPDGRHIADLLARCAPTTLTLAGLPQQSEGQSS